MHNLKGFSFALLLVGCTTAPDKKLPSASFTPHLSQHAASVACGEDIFWGTSTTPDMRYAFTYDNLGRLVNALGTLTAGGGTDNIDYTYDADSNLLHMLDVGAGYQYETTAEYGANGISHYVYSYQDSQQNNSWDYAYSNWLGPWQPQTETVASAGQSYTYALAYDTDGRMVSATPSDGSPPITYTYDDAGLTIAMDYNSGAYTGLWTYDASYRELSDVAGGTDQYAIATDTEYDWTGDQFNGLTYASGTEQDPHTLMHVDTQRMRFDCTMARTHAGQPLQIVKTGSFR